MLQTHKLAPKYWKQIIVLLFITPVLTELLTNNISAFDFFQPKLFLILAILLYGPVLLLRELAVRWNLSLAGYILLGLVYGIYNEGLFAKTIFQTHPPSPSFNDYGIVWSINTTWTAVIIIFHAFYAFLFPLLIVYKIFPSAANKPWLSKTWGFIFSGAFLLYISYAFLDKMQKPVVPLHFIVLLLVMAIMVLLSKNFNKGMPFKNEARVWPLCLYGLAFVITTFTIPNILAVDRINFFVFIFYMIVDLCIMILLLRKRYTMQALLIFCLSAELAFEASCILVAAVNHSTIGIITSTILSVIFAGCLFGIMIKRKSISRQTLSD